MDIIGFESLFEDAGGLSGISKCGLLRGEASVYRGVKVYPLYTADALGRGGIAGRLGVNTKAALYAFWVPERKTLIECSYFSLGGIEGVEIYKEAELVREIKGMMLHEVEAWMEGNMESVRPMEITGKITSFATDLFRDGYKEISARNMYKWCDAICRKKVDEMDVDAIAYLIDGRDSIDTACDGLVSYAKEQVAACKAWDIVVRGLAEERKGSRNPDDRLRDVNWAVTKLAEEKGAKTCSAVFDFGYETVCAVLTIGSKYCIGGSRKQTEQFIRRHFQPASMQWGDIDALMRVFVSYITEIKYRGVTVYRAEPMGYVPEDRLYNRIFNGDDFYPGDFEGTGLDCSVPTKDGKSILTQYVQGTCSIDGAKFLAEHGADAKEAIEYLRSSGYKDPVHIGILECLEGMA